MNWKRLVIATLLAGLVGLALHAAILSFVDPIVSSSIAGRTVLKMPYPPSIGALAAVTAILEQGLGMVVLFVLVGDRLPGRNWLSRGAAYAVLLLLLNGNLARQPIMNVAIGNPTWVALLQQADVWAARFMACLLVAALLPVRRPRADAVGESVR